MQLERLGVISFFGILVPGAYFTTFLLLALACVMELSGNSGHTQIALFLKNNAVAATSAFLFLSYLLGILIRLFAPNAVDVLSSKYWFFVRWKSKRKTVNEWMYEPFPYRKTLRRRVAQHGMGKVCDLMLVLNSEYGNSGNITFFNFCKLFVEAHSDTLARHVRQGEAMVRFLSGSCFAFIVSTILGLGFGFAFLFEKKYLFASVYLSLAVLSLGTLVGILERFKHQRRKEVATLWNSVYLLVMGIVPSQLGAEADFLREQLRFGLGRNPS